MSDSYPQNIDNPKFLFTLNHLKKFIFSPFLLEKVRGGGVISNPKDDFLYSLACVVNK